MRNILQLYKDERGNIVLFILGMLSIMMVLFLLVVNLSSALATKQQSETTVSQASLAATSAFYEEVKSIISNTSYPRPTDEEDPEYDEKMEVHLFFANFDSRVDSAKSGLTGPWYYDWSEKELELQAFDVVIEGALTGGRLLQEVVEGLLKGNSRVQQAAINMGILTIEKNGGILKDATLDIEDSRITIRAATEVSSSSYKNYVQSVNEDLFQESAGPKVDFIDLIWTRESPVRLEYE